MNLKGALTLLIFVLRSSADVDDRGAISIVMN